jgi:hypothetical protein
MTAADRLAGVRYSTLKIHSAIRLMRGGCVLRHQTQGPALGQRRLMFSVSIFLRLPLALEVERQRPTVDFGMTTGPSLFKNFGLNP